MAEQILYENPNEPAFPFDAIRGQLKWLSAYLSEHIIDPKFDLDPLLNPILVVTRARTSTIQDMHTWEMLEDLAKRLNSALSAIDASHHRLELVPRGTGSLFGTCSQSRRFH